MLAVLAAGMRCVAIPTITAPLDPKFGPAQLFPAGMQSAEVDAILAFFHN